MKEYQPGNLIQTEFGLCIVHNTSFGDTQVKGKDGRVLWAKEVQPVCLSNKTFEMLGFQQCPGDLWMRGCVGFRKHKAGYYQLFPFCGKRQFKYVHEIQNFWYWFNHEKIVIPYGYESEII